MTTQILAAIRAFNEIIIEGIPFLLKKNETAFLSFMCSLSAIDALSGYRYDIDDVGKRFKDFIKEYFPHEYAPHVDNLYLLRCRMLHNFSPAYFTLTHANPSKHLKQSGISDIVLSDEVFFSDLKNAAEKFFEEVRTDANLKDTMNNRLLNLNKGGAIYYT